MSVVRRHHKGEFVILPNAVANDPALSWAAKGMLAYLIAKPADWEVSVADLMRQGGGGERGTGRQKTYGLLRELIVAGYITREINAKGPGRGSNATYTVFDVVQSGARPDAENQHAVATTVGFSSRENRHAIEEKQKEQKLPPNPHRPSSPPTERGARRRRSVGRRRSPEIDWQRRASYWRDSGGDWPPGWGVSPGRSGFKGPVELFGQPLPDGASAGEGVG